MEVIGSFSGEGPGAYVRRFMIEASLTKGQVVCWSSSNAVGEGEVGDPDSVNDYSDMVGILLSQDLTYSTVTGAGGVLGEVTADPLQRFLGRSSGTATSGGALSTDGTDGHIVTLTSTSATVLAAVGFGSHDYIGGYAIPLSVTNKGQVRIITATSDGVSNTVTNPFDRLFVSGDTVLRTLAPFINGIALTTDHVEFDNLLVAGQVIPDTGQGTVVQVMIDDSFLDSVISPNKTRGTWARIFSETAPEVKYEVISNEHAFRNAVS